MAGHARTWTFLSNHGHVLVCLARDPTARIRDMADWVGITERAVQLILRDLDDGGYVRRRRVGRRNEYTVVGRSRFRHPLEAEVRIADFTALLGDGAPGGAARGRARAAAASPARRH